MQCVKTNKDVERAVQFVLGDTLIVDSLEDARRVAYEEAPRATQGRGQPKLVTLLGERIGKNGNMSYSADAQQDRWEVRDLQMKQRELAEVENKLVEVAALEESGVLQLEADAQALQRKLASYNDRLAVLSRRVESKKEELKGFEEQMKKIEATLAAKQKDVQQFEKEVDERQKKAYAAGKSKFAALGAELQIPDVARAVQDMRRAEEKDRQDEAQLLKRQTQLEAESRFLEQSVSNQSISADTKHVAEMLTVTEKEKLELEAQVRELDKRVEALLKEASEGRNGDLALDEELRTKRAELDTARTRVQKRAQDESILRSKMKTYEQERTDILRQAQVDEIKVPQKEDGSVAFDGLTREERSMTSATLAGHSDELQRKIALTQMEVDQLRPNFKSQAKFDDIQKKLEVTTKEADDARKKCQNAERDFNDVKQRRKETFLQCYNELSRSIDQIYKEMTSYADEEGGTAFLDLDDEEEPYAKGVSLTTMMPRKRFRELHLQSGGERTVAALALLFAMHQYQRPPFMILDEVDAALDQRNVQALVNYLKKADFQAIVISLKDKLYGEADALVGVYKPHRSEASEVLTLDLRPYAANDAPE
jgi:structural maintenance of chromosome 1